MISVPKSGDIVARREQCEGVPVYVLRTMPGPEQFRLSDYERAIERASIAAEREHVCVWFETDGQFVLLRNFGADMFT